MNKLTIALCDDDETAVTIVGGTVKSLLEKRGVEGEIYAYTTAAELRQSMEAHRFDLIMLDISMKEEDGIKFAKELRARGDRTEIVFVSSKEERVFESLAVAPFAFVRKRLFIADIKDMLDHFLAVYSEGAGGRVLELRTATEIVHVNVDEIVYIESFRDTQSVYLSGREQPVVLSSTMTELENQLAKYSFIRIHKSILVNARYINRVDGCEVVLNSGKVLYSATKKAKQVRDEYMAFNRDKVSAMFKLKK